MIELENKEIEKIVRKIRIFDTIIIVFFFFETFVCPLTISFILFGYQKRFELGEITLSVFIRIRYILFVILLMVMIFPFLVLLIGKIWDRIKYRKYYKRVKNWEIK